MSAAVLAVLASLAAEPPGAAASGAPPAPDPALLAACAPHVHPATLRAVIAVESGGDPLAVNINGGPRVRPRTVAEAVRVARAAVRRGHSVDLGLMQVNSRNLAVLGTTLAAMFDPCANVRAGATLLADSYAAAARRLGSGQPALRAALSAYNTGDFARGFRNGYVARYYGRRAAALPTRNAGRAGWAAPGDPYTAATTVFTRVARPLPAAVASDAPPDANLAYLEVLRAQPTPR